MAKIHSQYTIFCGHSVGGRGGAEVSGGDGQGEERRGGDGVEKHIGQTGTEADLHFGGRLAPVHGPTDRIDLVVTPLVNATIRFHRRGVASHRAA